LKATSEPRLVLVPNDYNQRGALPVVAGIALDFSRFYLWPAILATKDAATRTSRDSAF